MRISSPKKTRETEALARRLSALFSHYGPQNWWPAQSQFEVIVGAYLTQNTSWRNVEITLANLRRARALNAAGIRLLPKAQLERLLRPSGFFRQKAYRLKLFVRFLDQQYGGSLKRMFQRSTHQLREELLSLEGVGRETADSILLYAGGHPVFVVDGYTRRIFDESRQGIIANATSVDYDELRLTLESAVYEHLLPEWNFDASAGNPRHPATRMSRAKRTDAARIFSELHAVIVRAGSEHCRPTAKCEGCPLESFLPKASLLKNATLPHRD